ncbi:hypothetical protein [Winogradskya humida]|uniref:Excreted virulence factor EspC (Type VII ESX diderm) n=1 Tax=Winogradskya humida TaxID=113566 RepID=A0ABQ4A7U5_9ACTN|nr:hypothetical protein [Actinoplanes humidus]GIE26930.1 hypothetical protein Ahu01nite_100320 [Actinoplanes humidus]
MTQPSDDQVEASIHALTAEGGVWSGMATEVDAMAAVARSLTLNAFHFSGVGHLAGIEDVYRDLQERIATLLQQAADNFDNTAGALTKAADDYQRDEDNTVHRMKNVY